MKMKKTIKGRKRHHKFRMLGWRDALAMSIHLVQYEIEKTMERIPVKDARIRAQRKAVATSLKKLEVVLACKLEAVEQAYDKMRRFDGTANATIHDDASRREYYRN